MRWRRGLRQLGHAVDWFRDGADADAALAGAPYDAWCSTSACRAPTAWPGCARWRRRGLALPVLILTARDGVEQRIAGLDAGADDYLIKPIAIDELAARLRALLRRARGRAQALWTHGALRYDPATQAGALARPAGGTDRPRTGAAGGAARAPAARAVEGAAAEKLYDWSGAEPESNALEVHVHHLRRKIAPRHRAHRARRRLCARARPRPDHEGRAGEPAAPAARLPAAVRAAGVGRRAAGLGRPRAPRGQRALRHRDHPPGAPGAGDAGRAAVRRRHRRCPGAARRRCSARGRPARPGDRGVECRGPAAAGGPRGCAAAAPAPTPRASST